MSLLEIKNVNKSFGDNHVLTNISISLEAGEIHSIMGENGAGKSTLIKIIGGVYSMDSGEIRIDGKRIDVHNPIEAYAAGIGIVHQELSVADNMTVAQNVFVNREPTKAFGFVDFKKMNRMAAEEFKKIGISIDPETVVRDLSVGMQQIVEIVKVLSQDVRILILDEPTSALSDRESQNLFDLMNVLKARGTCIIFISHKLKEILQVSDRVSVLRDGNFIGTLTRENMEEKKIISMMVGRELGNLYPPKASSRNGEEILRTEGLTCRGKFEDVSLSFRAGEITGMFGLVGAGRTEFAWSVFGAARVDAGKIFYCGKEVSFKAPSQAIRSGIGYLSEDRKRTGLFVAMNVKDNTVVTDLKAVSGPLGMLDDRKIQQIASEYVEALDIHPRNCENRLVANLSGGNQQKVLFAKWLQTHPRLLIVDEPTRGVDVGAKAKIHSILRQLAENGMAVVMISSELPEILGLSDRIAVMSDGHLAAVMENDGLTEEDVVSKAFAHGGEPAHE